MTKEKSISDIEEELLYEVDQEAIPPADVIAYNELRSANDLYRMYKEEILDIHPNFQRDVVWSDAAQARFIDSLMKSLPIPSMCFSLDFDKQQWKVIDGLQRMSSIIRFMDDDNWVFPNLEDIQKSIRNKSVKEIREKQKDLYSRVSNITLPITILRCDYSKDNHLEYMFTIFHRLNSGSVRVNNQEIRNAIFSGPFNDFIKSYEENGDWLKLLGVKDISGNRFRRVELVLRIFAFIDSLNSYNGRLNTFLNSYMKGKRAASSNEIDDKKKIFNDCLSVLLKLTGGKSLKSTLFKASKISNALIEALFYGVASNLSSLQKSDTKELLKAYKYLLNSEPFSDSQLRESIMKKEKVINRLSKAKMIFSDVD